MGFRLTLPKVLQDVLVHSSTALHRHIATELTSRATGRARDETALFGSIHPILLPWPWTCWSCPSCGHACHRWDGCAEACGQAVHDALRTPRRTRRHRMAHDSASNSWLSLLLGTLILTDFSKRIRLRLEVVRYLPFPRITVAGGSGTQRAMSYRMRMSARAVE